MRYMFNYSGVAAADITQKGEPHSLLPTFRAA
jgi:hypothetical protein